MVETIGSCGPEHDFEGYEIMEAPHNYGFIIVLPPDAATAANQLTMKVNQVITEKLGKKFFMTLVGVDGRIAHITLAQGGFPFGIEGEIQNLAKTFSQKAKGLTLTLEPCKRLSRKGHQRYMMKQWKDRLLDQYDLNPDQRRMVLEHGFAESAELFQPHVTLGRLGTDKAILDKQQNDFAVVEKLLSTFNIPPQQFVIEAITIGRLGYAGNVESVL